MKNINVLVLVAALVALGVGLMMASGERQSEITSDVVFTDLQKNIDRVNSLKIESADGVLLDANLVADNWVASDKSNYPLDEEKIVSLLNAMVLAKLDAAKTAKVKNHARLGLQDLTAEDSQSRLLQLKAGDRSWQILLGNNASSGNGMFIRRPAEQQTWLTKTSFDIPGSSNDWLKKQILDLSSQDVLKVTQKGLWTAVKAPPSDNSVTDGESEHSQGNDSDWVILDMPEGRELNYASVVTNAVEDIIELQLDELLQQKPLDVSQHTLVSEIEVSTVDGDISIKLYTHEDENLVVYEGGTVENHWNKWVFKVSQFNSGKLNKELESFLTELPTDLPEGGSEADVVNN